MDVSASLEFEEERQLAEFPPKSQEKVWPVQRKTENLRNTASADVSFERGTWTFDFCLKKACAVFMNE
jgi:hypothetical protein